MHEHDLPRFVADVMVGKLARWLRMLGYDVLYSNRFKDDEIRRIADAEDRIVLTRDVELHQRARNSMLIADDHYESQVRQVVASLELQQFFPFTRCAECNTPLVETDRESVFVKIPPYVYLTQKHFAWCPSCDRVYWRGTHTDRILEKLQRWINAA
jgi:uncharacterized protein with PIN domain